MFELFIALVFGIAGVALLLAGKGKKVHRNSYGIDYTAMTYIGAFCAVFAGIWVFVGLLATGVGWGHQISDIQNVTKYGQNQAVYQAKATEITGQIEGYLAHEYPDLETKIFGELAGHAGAKFNPQLMFAAYPQLQSSKTIMALTNQIVALQSKIYEQSLNINQAEKNIRTRNSSPWLIGWVIPSS